MQTLHNKYIVISGEQAAGKSMLMRTMLNLTNGTDTPKTGINPSIFNDFPYPANIFSAINGINDCTKSDVIRIIKITEDYWSKNYRAGDYITIIFTCLEECNIEGVQEFKLKR